ncbi:YidB family protein [soil metagenome]
MGLLDILNGMANGPRGPSDPNDKSGGMSPMTMAILALLAYKGYKHYTGSQPATQGRPQPVPAPTQASVPDSGGLGGMLGNIFGGNGGQAGGGMGGLLQGPLGGLLAGGAAGSVLSGGLGDLLKQFQQNGHGEVADSWVGSGPNKQISPNDLGAALGANEINQLTSRTGMSRDQLLSELSNELPGAVDEFTPHGRLPTEEEAASRWV